MESRRQFLLSCIALLPASGASVPSEVVSISDPATEFRLLRLTNPQHTSLLPGYQNTFISRHASFFLFSSDASGSTQPYRMDLKRGDSNQLAEVTGLHPESLLLSPDEKNCYYLDSSGLTRVALANSRARQIYRVADGWDLGYGLGISTDGLYATIVEKKGNRYRIQVINLANNRANVAIEADGELSLPVPRPKRAGFLYRKGKNELYVAGFDGQNNQKLTVAAGEIGPAFWSRDGRSVDYLNTPNDPHQARAIREYTPDVRRDALVANTSQYGHFGSNGDGSVFIGASRSKASPYVLLVLRKTKRELTLCEHRASDASLVSPVFSPDSRRVFFQTDKDGHMAIYMMNVERLVEETDE